VQQHLEEHEADEAPGVDFLKGVSAVIYGKDLIMVT
jgi:hypothetical protein